MTEIEELLTEVLASSYDVCILADFSPHKDNLREEHIGKLGPQLHATSSTHTSSNILDFLITRVSSTTVSQVNLHNLQNGQSITPSAARYTYCWLMIIRICIRMLRKVDYSAFASDLAAPYAQAPPSTCVGTLIFMYGSMLSPKSWTISTRHSNFRTIQTIAPYIP